MQSRHFRAATPLGFFAAAAFALACTTLPATTASAAVTGRQPARDPLFVPGALTGVTSISSSDAWAVGASDTDPHTPILAHWNGKSWTAVSSSALPKQSALTAVAKFSGGAWAVGGTSGQPLVLRLTGATAHRIPAPKVLHGLLTAVAATSAANAWAVGGVGGGPALILHWNGSAWH